MTGVETIEIRISGLRWSSNWNGYEVGFDSSGVVGLYTADHLDCDFYIDSENGEILAVMPHEEEEE